MTIDLLWFLKQIFASKIFWSLIVAYVVTHTIKTVVERYESNKWTWRMFWETGGMPSSHASATLAVTTAIAYETGPSAVFFLAVLVTLITVRDSYGMRASVGEQAHLLNVLTSKLKLRKKARIVLGHTPLQVTIGAIIGLLVAIVIYSI